MEWEKGVLNRGNLGRIKSLMDKARAGEKLTIGFIGGSITQGSLSDTPETCYAYLVYEWWKKTFPQAEFLYVNAGVGGTTSQFGVARVQEDLLCYLPDFVIAEFSVNDENTDFFQETYEGLIRNILSAESRPALLLLHNVRYDTGASAEEKHLEVGKHYRLPCLSIKETVYRSLQEGAFKNEDITPDNLHPNSRGHRMIAEVVTDFLAKTASEKEQTADKKAYGLPEPLTANTFEHSKRYQNDTEEVFCEGFEADKEECSKNVKKIFRKGWTAAHNNDKIFIYVEGSGIAVQYRKSVRKPTPVAIAVVDGEEDKAVVLDGNFEEDWGDCLYISTLARGMDNKKHKVEIRVTGAHPEDVVPFYLVSVIGSF